MRRISVPSGTKFGRLTVIEETAAATGKRFFRLLCSCGTEVTVSLGNLRSGNSESCGCGHVRHGMAQTPTYAVWENIIARCLNPKHPSFDRYGGRGISMAPSWRRFEGFLADMGEAPPGLEIERIDNDGNYDPGNCRWSTRTEQMQNMRRNKNVVLNGVTLCCSSAERALGLRRATISKRVSETGVSHQGATDYYARKRAGGGVKSCCI